MIMCVAKRATAAERAVTVKMVNVMSFVVVVK